MNKRLERMRDELLERLNERLEESTELFILSRPFLCKQAGIENPPENLEGRKKENDLQVKEICDKLLEILKAP